MAMIASITVPVKYRGLPTSHDADNHDEGHGPHTLHGRADCRPSVHLGRLLPPRALGALGLGFHQGGLRNVDKSLGEGPELRLGRQGPVGNVGHGSYYTSVRGTYVAPGARVWPQSRGPLYALPGILARLLHTRSRRVPRPRGHCS